MFCRLLAGGALALTLSVARAPLVAQEALFRRGDCDLSDNFDIADPIFLLVRLFVAQEPVPCQDGCDTNDDGTLAIDDAIGALNALFLNGPAPAPPHAACGPDLTGDALACSNSPPCRTPRPSVAAGDVLAGSVVLWARVGDRGRVTFQAASDPYFGSVLAEKSVDVSDPFVPAKVTIEGLAPATEYYYRAIDARGASTQGRFRTPAPRAKKTGLRFGVAGDWRGELVPYPAVVNAAARDHDFFMLLGDTIYADVPSPVVRLPQAMTPDEFRRKHTEVYFDGVGANALRALRSATVTFATIDDHEVTNDFAGGAHPSTDARFAFTTEEFINETTLYRNGLNAFLDYNPLREETYAATGDPRTAGKPKLYRYRSFGKSAAFFMLDARSFRDPALPGVSNPLDLLEIVGFLVAAFDSTRTMLGAAQLADLKSDLLLADAEDITWKFVVVPEPIQNLGVALAQDRFEGYAAERRELLEFINTNGIRNVVFIAADIHGTLVNNLYYRDFALTREIETTAFEVTTPSVAYDPPFGPFVVEAAAAAGLLTPGDVATYESLPVDGQDQFIEDLVNLQLTLLGYDPIGLSGSPIDFTLLEGGFTRTHVYGWTEFEIDALGATLTVTVYGIEPYTMTQILNDPAVLAREPEAVLRFRVNPQ